LRHVWLANKLGGGIRRLSSLPVSPAACVILSPGHTHAYTYTLSQIASNNRLQLKVIRTPFSWAPLQDSPALPADPPINSLAQLKPTPCCCYCPEIHKRTPINAQLKAKRIRGQGSGHLNAARERGLKMGSGGFRGTRGLPARTPTGPSCIITVKVNLCALLIECCAACAGSGHLEYPPDPHIAGPPRPSARLTLHKSEIYLQKITKAAMVYYRNKDALRRVDFNPNIFQHLNGTFKYSRSFKPTKKYGV